MAVDLKRVTEGRVERAHRVLIYGMDSIGKSSFAAGAPDPFFLDANRGRYALNVKGVDIENWNDLLAWLAAIEAGQVVCKSVVLDDLSTMENMSIEKAFPGSTVMEARDKYKKIETALMLEWRPLIAQIERLWLRGKNIILVGHTLVRSFNDPTGPSYSRQEVSCTPEVAAALRQWVDHVLFAREEHTMASKGKAVSTGVRVAHTRRTPSFDAKARGTNEFPEKILLGWSSFQEAVQGDLARADTMMESIKTMLAEIGDAALDGLVHVYIKENPGQLPVAHNRVVARLEEFRKSKAGAEEVKT